jgi:capsular polysaccharide biosynthesis protein/Mrp family chromosome partitioning ATPase
MDTQMYNEVTSRDYLRVIFRQKSIIITAFAAVMFAVILGLMLRTPAYQAQVKMLISAEKLVEAPYYQEITGGGSHTGADATVTQSEIVKSLPVLDRTVKALNLDLRPLDYEKEFASNLKSRMIDLDVASTKAKLSRMTPQQQKAFLYRRAIDTLKGNIEVEPIRDTNMFRISVTDFDRVGAAVTANVVSRAYVMFDLQQQLTELELKYGAKHPTVLQLRDNLEQMARSLNGQPLPDEEAIGPASVKIIEQASLPAEPQGVSKGKTIALAAVMALFLGLVLAFLFEYLDQTVKSPRDLEDKLSLVHLGGIPRLGFGNQVMLSQLKNVNGHMTYIRAFSNLADQLRLVLSTKKAKTILLAEAEREEDITAIVANLGFTLSQHTDKRILIIDANIRKQSDVDENGEPGFFDLVSGKSNFQDAVKEIGPHLWMMPAGTMLLNPITLLDCDRTRDVIAQARSKFDLVLVEGPDLRSYKDSLLLSTYVDGVILVVSESRTRVPVINWILKPLKDHKANLLGAILNRRKFVIPKFVYERV